MRDGHGEKVGFVLNESFLFLLAGWEPVRPAVIGALHIAGIKLVSPQPETVARWAVRPAMTLWPYAFSNEIHVYDEDARRGHQRIAVFVPRTTEVDVQRKKDRSHVVGLLKRAGMLAADDEVHFYAGTADRPNMASEARSLKVQNAAPAGGETNSGISPIPLLPTPNGAEPDEDNREFSEGCRFQIIDEFVPETLRERVRTRLRMCHQSFHFSAAYQQWQTSGLPPRALKSQPDRAFWGPASQDVAGVSPRARWARPESWAWPEGIDDWVDELVEAHDGYFAVVGAYRARVRFPILWAAAGDVRSTLDRKGGAQLGGLGGLDRELAETAWVLAVALWSRTRDRRTWPASVTAICGVCEEEFDPSIRRHELVIRFGAQNWCSACLRALWPDRIEQYLADAPEPLAFVSSGNDMEVLLEAVRFLASVEDGPPRFSLRATPMLFDPSTTQANQWFLARVAVPTVMEQGHIAEKARWTTLLQMAGVIGSAVRQTRGTTVTANDGHRCRSLLELAIDDFFSLHGIPHDPEPTYPYHAILNPGGGRRADWMLPHRVVVEAAGLNSEEYLTKLEEKVLLARLSGFEMVVVTPAHIPDLSVIFERFISCASLSDAIINFPGSI